MPQIAKICFAIADLMGCGYKKPSEIMRLLIEIFDENMCRLGDQALALIFDNQLHSERKMLCRELCKAGNCEA
jgi:hypothetical protein